MTSNLANKVTNLMYREKSPLLNLVKRQFADDVAKDVDALLNLYHRNLSRHLRNAAPEYVPDAKDPAFPDRGGEKYYPQIEHEHEPVPDASTTETSIPSKVSTPNYDDLNERIEALQRSITTLFDDSAENGDKVESMREAISALDDLSEWLKQL
jgi:hypothetical protein